MVKFSAIVASMLALSATAAMAQTGAIPFANDGLSSSRQAYPQEAMAPMRHQAALDSFILDEYGNVYDSHGDIIKPRLTRY
ncbi:MAG: hypothetical protein JSR91_00790 [Proteobacteria bacterium]|nr:hypothetical protein [Pseudomonadota bacterium]